MRFTARVLAGGLLAAGLVAVPAAAANAATTYTVIWIDSYGTSTQTYSCSAGAQVQPGMNVDKITSGCADRIWLHQGYSEPGNVGTGNSYCVNPTAEAYAMSTTIDFQQVLPTANPFDCDYTTKFGFEWSGGGVVNPGSSSLTYSYCEDGYTDTNPDPLGPGGYDVLLAIANSCNTRIWVHELNGNALACISPGGGWDNPAGGIPAQEYQVSGNQAPCSAG
jgi:hypothetical protein